jgi:adrenodoxin-NADP+ reductase
VNLQSAVPRARKRLTELMVKTALDSPSERDVKRWANAKRDWHLKFFRSPQEFIADSSGQRVGKVRLNVMRMEVGSDLYSVIHICCTDRPCQCQNNDATMCS